MLNDFLNTALWSTNDYDIETEMLDANYCIDDINDEFKAECQALIDDFMQQAEELFTPDELRNAPIGHDLWLTIEGHGAGFWDGDYENGEALTEMCKKLVPYSHKFSEKLNESIEKPID